MKRTLFIISFFVFCLGYSFSAQRGGLVIAGGAINSDTTGIYDKFIEMSGGKSAIIGIIPAATSNPIKYSNWFIADLTKRGFPAANIKIIELAVKNDKLTKDVDESTWVSNGDNDVVVKEISKCNAVWFLGGDQTNILKVLRRDDGSNTKALDAIYGLYEKGGVIGGTSAGAAIQSEIMIAGGDSLSALTMDTSDTFKSMDDQEIGPLVVRKGLGFFKIGTIDQHFDRKSRLGRLIRVAVENKSKYRYSFGVDENTAMIYYKDTNSVEVAGDGSVTIIDVYNAVYKRVKSVADISNVKLSIIEEGDSFKIDSNEFTISKDKLLTNKEEYFNITTPIINSGVFSPNGFVKNFASFFLMDNKGATSIKSYSFNDKGIGVELIFRKTDDSKGYWQYKGTSIIDRYSVTGIVLDIKPVKISFGKL